MSGEGAVYVHKPAPASPGIQYQRLHALIVVVLRFSTRRSTPLHDSGASPHIPNSPQVPPTAQPEIRAGLNEAKDSPTLERARCAIAKATEAPKVQTYRIDLPSATVTVSFKKGPVSKSSVKAMLLQALESLG